MIGRARPGIGSRRNDRRVKLRSAAGRRRDDGLGGRFNGYDLAMESGSGKLPRCIRLRRPATLSVMDEPHVPDAPPEKLAEVDRRWEALRRANPHYYDGRLYHVLGVHRNGYGGAVAHVADCAYRYYAVQDEDFDLGVRPLGTKGIIERDGRYLLGRRSVSVGAYQGQWEFAPAGVVEPGRSPVEVILAELTEETGLTAAREPTPIAILFDSVLRCWEIIFRIGVAEPEGEPTTDEYDELRWCAVDGLPAALTPVARQVVALL